VYETAPRETDLTLAGPVGVSLKVATSGTDADFIVKLIDVYPPGESLGGYQQLVQGNIFRARWRESYNHPKPMLPGRPTSIQYSLPDVFHTFKKGHRLMVHVQSTWFPLFDRNPQRYVTNINQALESDFRPATMRVYRSKQLATYLTLPVLPLSQPVRKPGENP
jgi:putative CocE/NonD family hydrolase